MDIEKINEITMESFSRISNLHGHIGFDSLPYQVVNQAVRNGFLFNILCIGETGLGKSTLMDALFNTDFESKPSLHNSEGVTLKTNTYQLKEGNVNLKLTIVDTVGYGDQINKSNSFDDIANYIDAQFEDCLQEELKAKRSLLTYQDTRIHVCLYFICPTGHGLKAIDLVCMQKLDKKVNIIPIIAKADTISSTDLPAFKAKILNELIRYGINIYRFPTNDASVSNVNSKMNDLIPFAIVGSTDFLQVGNKKVRCRKYPWGILEVENEAHSDFVKLREMLIRTNMEDMRDRTHDCYYELYRKERLEQLGFTDVECDSKNVKYKENCELKRAAYFEELQRKEENMRKNFVNKVRDAEAELKQAEKELYDKFEKLKQGYTDKQKKLDEGRRQLDEDIQEFYRLKARVTTKNHQSNYTLTLGRSKKK